MSNVQINPISPDPNARDRYGPSDERAHREQNAGHEAANEKTDRLEISKDARESFLVRSTGPEMEFARKALDKSIGLTENRISQTLERLESGYYRLPMVIRKIVAHLVPGLR